MYNFRGLKYNSFSKYFVRTMYVCVYIHICASACIFIHILCGNFVIASIAVIFFFSFKFVLFKTLVVQNFFKCFLFSEKVIPLECFDLLLHRGKVEGRKSVCLINGTPNNVCLCGGENWCHFWQRHSWHCSVTLQHIQHMPNRKPFSKQ